jgi:hypothetical protein
VLRALFRCQPFLRPVGKSGRIHFQGTLVEVPCGNLTSYMKISKTRVATGRGKVVRKSVRNQDEAYIDVWKLCERKWVFRSGSCSCGERGGQGGTVRGCWAQLSISTQG